MPMITNEDLLKEISLTELTQLSDLNAKGTLDQEVLDDAISDAVSFIGSFVPIPDSPTPLLKNLAVELTLMELRKRNKLGEEERKKRLGEIEGYLIRMAKKQIPTTTAERPQKQSSFAFRHTNKRIDTKGYL